MHLFTKTRSCELRQQHISDTLAIALTISKPQKVMQLYFGTAKITDTYTMHAQKYTIKGATRYTRINVVHSCACNFPQDSMLTKFCSKPSENHWRRGFYIIVWQQANRTSGDPSVMLTLLRICTSHRVDERPSAPRAHRNCMNFMRRQGESSARK